MSSTILSHVEIHWTSHRIYKNTTVNASWISHFLSLSEQVLDSSKSFFFSLSKISHKDESSPSSPKPCHCFGRKSLGKINSKHIIRTESYFHLLPSRAFLIIPVTFREHTDCGHNVWQIWKALQSRTMMGRPVQIRIILGYIAIPQTLNDMSCYYKYIVPLSQCPQHNNVAVVTNT